MRNKNKIIASLAACAMLTALIPVQANAAVQESSTIKVGRDQLAAPISVNEELEVASFTELSAITFSEAVDSADVISVSESEISAMSNDDIAPASLYDTKYYWSYATAPYTFTQRWSTDHDVYLSYPYYDDGLFYPAATELIDNPSNADYETAVRQGYVNDTWAQSAGLHMYYHSVPANPRLNSITVLIDDNVGFQIFNMDLEPVLTSDSTDVLLFDHMSVNHNGSTKHVITVKLAAGNYFLAFGEVEGEGNYHYAMFTGNPLPILQTYVASGLFQGSVQWDGRSSSQTYQCNPVTISVASGYEDLFALYRITFDDTTTAVNNVYVSSVEMMYRSPNSYSYKTVATMAGLGRDWIDYAPDAGSIAGTYRTQVTVNWANGLSYVYARYFTSALMYVDYLVPFGEVSVSF